MTVETATYISDLNSSLPAATDPVSEGDNHTRLLKSTIKATFPNVSGAVTPTHTELNYVDGVTSPIQTQINALIPSQTGKADYLLTTNGTATSWTQTITVSSITTGTISSTSTSASSIRRLDVRRLATAAQSVMVLGGFASFDCTNGSHQYVTLSAGSVTFQLSNPPTTGASYRFLVEMTNAGLATITWPAAVKWPGGTQPTWTNSGVDIVELVTRDGGTTWYCVNYQRDIK